MRASYREVGEKKLPVIMARGAAGKRSGRLQFEGGKESRGCTFSARIPMLAKRSTSAGALEKWSGCAVSKAINRPGSAAQ